MINTVYLIKSDLWNNCNVDFNPNVSHAWYSDNKLISFFDIFSFFWRLNEKPSFSWFKNSSNISININKILSLLFKNTNFSYKSISNQKRLKFTKNYLQAQKYLYLNLINRDKLSILKNFFNTLAPRKKNKNTHRIEISLLEKISICENVLIQIDNFNMKIIRKLNKYSQNLKISCDIFYIENLSTINKKNFILNYMNNHYSDIFINKLFSESLCPIQSVSISIFEQGPEGQKIRNGNIQGGHGNIQHIYSQSKKKYYFDAKNKFNIVLQKSISKESLIKEKIEIIKQSLVSEIEQMKNIYKFKIEEFNIFGIKDIFFECIKNPNTLNFDLVNHIEEMYFLLEELINSYFELSDIIIKISEITEIEALKNTKLNKFNLSEEIFKI